MKVDQYREKVKLLTDSVGEVTDLENVTLKHSKNTFVGEKKEEEKKK